MVVSNREIVNTNHFLTTPAMSNPVVLQTQDLKVGQANEPCIRLIQKNLIENSVQDCLPYILNYYGPCYYFFSLL